MHVKLKKALFYCTNLLGSGYVSIDMFSLHGFGFSLDCESVLSSSNSKGV